MQKTYIKTDAQPNSHCILYPLSNSLSSVNTTSKKLQPLTQSLTMSLALRAQSEWFKSQKHAELMQPGTDFQVVESQSGRPVFFSIGSDKALYASREISGSLTGWTLHNMTQDMITPAGLHSGDSCQIKSFAVFRNAQSRIDLAAILTCQGKDYLLVSLDHGNSDDAWTAGVQWRYIPFDCANRASATVFLNEVQILGTLDRQDFVSSATIIVDGTRISGSTTLDRYYIIPDVSAGIPLWNLHELAVDLEVGKVISLVGQRPDDPISGLYTYGKIMGQTQLTYAMLYNYFDATIPPTVARFTIPDGMTSLSTAAMSTASGQGTGLFAVGSNGVSLFAPENQGDLAKAITIISDPMTFSSTDLRSHASGGVTAIWGVAVNGKLWYSRCASGSERNAAAWTTPISILEHVQNFSFYVGDSDGGQTLFAHIDSGLIAMIQDTVTRTWRTRIVALPSLDIHDMIEFDGTTTRLIVFDPSSNLGKSDVEVSIRSCSTEVAVYVNNVYHVLQPNTPLVVSTDVSGAITIEQPVETTSAVSYQATLSNSTLTINPASPIISRLAVLTTDQGLKDSQVKDAYTGKTKPLVPSDVSSNDLSSAAGALATLHDKMKQLPEDGSKAAPSPPPKDHAPVSFSDAIKLPAGEFFQWVGDKIKQGFNVAIEWANGFWHAVVRIAGKVWHTVLDCLQAVGHAINWVVEQIKVAWNEFVSFLSFLFDWQDIVRTHKVLKIYWDKWTVAAINALEQVEHRVDDAFNDLEAKVAKLTGLSSTQSSTPVGHMLGASQEHADAPQAHWSIQHFQNGLPASSGNATIDKVENLLGGAIVNLLQRIGTDLEAIADGALQGLTDAFHQINEQVVKQIGTLSIGQIAERLLGIVVELVLKEAQNLIVKGIDIFRVLVSYVVESLGQTINIPILSPFYKRVTGSDLSMIDLLCLVGAVPATVLYKMATGHTPFDDHLVDFCQRSKSFGTVAKFDGGSASSASTINVRPHVPMIRMLAKAQGGEPPTAAEKQDGDDDKVREIVVRIFTCITDVTGGIGGLVFAILADEEALSPKVKMVLGRLNVGAFFLFITPNINSNCNPANAAKWPWIMDDIVSLLSFGKVCFDNAPGVKEAFPVYKDKIGRVTDGILNALWMIPAIGKIATTHDKQGEQAACAGSLLADIAGMAFGVAQYKPIDPKVKLVALTVGALTVGGATTVGTLAAGIGGIIVDSQDV